MGQLATLALFHTTSWPQRASTAAALRGFPNAPHLVALWPRLPGMVPGKLTVNNARLSHTEDIIQHGYTEHRKRWNSR
jgi:hypothetical protein